MTMPEPFHRRSRNWIEKFAGAFRGVFVGVRRQNSFRVHFVFAAAVAMLALWLQVTKLEACLLLLCVFLVLAAEMFNSSLETLARAIDARYNPHLADGLDIASAAVLTTAAGAALVGLVILGPRLWQALVP